MNYEARALAYMADTTFVNTGEWYPVSGHEEAAAIYGDAEEFPGGYEIRTTEGLV